RVLLIARVLCFARRVIPGAARLRAQYRRDEQRHQGSFCQKSDVSGDVHGATPVSSSYSAVPTERAQVVRANRRLIRTGRRKCRAPRTIRCPAGGTTALAKSASGVTSLCMCFPRLPVLATLLVVAQRADAQRPHLSLAVSQ